MGLGGNIPIDATIALEFLPQSRRSLVSLLSLWQPIGVIVASAVAYGTAAKWRCDPKLPSCKAVAAGQPCCTVSSNMGWRYEMLVLGFMTLTIFFLRYVVFTFHESPKFLLSRGREAEAIEILHKIAKFNKAPPPELTTELFAAIDEADGHTSGHLGTSGEGTQSTAQATRNVAKGFARELARLKSIFAKKLTCFIFALLAIAYMVRFLNHIYYVHHLPNLGRLLVLQSCWRLFTYHSVAKQCIVRSRFCFRHVPAVYYHLYARDHRCSYGLGVGAVAFGRTQMVACLLCTLSRSLYGNVHPSQKHPGLCWLERA